MFINTVLDIYMSRAILDLLNYDELCNRFIAQHPVSYFPDMDDFAKRCRDSMNGLEMLKCSEKHLVVELTMATIKKWWY